MVFNDVIVIFEHVISGKLHVSNLENQTPTGPGVTPSRGSANRQRRQIVKMTIETPTNLRYIETLLSSVCPGDSIKIVRAPHPFSRGTWGDQSCIIKVKVELNVNQRTDTGPIRDGDMVTCKHGSICTLNFSASCKNYRRVTSYQQNDTGGVEIHNNLIEYLFRQYSVSVK